METNDLNDNLRLGYDLKKLKVRRVGEGREQMNKVQLDVDVARVFPFRRQSTRHFGLLIRIKEHHKSELI